MQNSLIKHQRKAKLKSNFFLLNSQNEKWLFFAVVVVGVVAVVGVDVTKALTVVELCEL